MTLVKINWALNFTSEILSKWETSLSCGYPGRRTAAAPRHDNSTMDQLVRDHQRELFLEAYNLSTAA